MIISANMDLNQLADCLSDYHDITLAPLLKFRARLAAQFAGLDTADVPGDAWLDLVNDIDWYEAERALRRAGFEVGDRIEAGKGDDREVGKIVATLDETTCVVAWSSGVRTEAAIEDLSHA